jgi:hypothetical protein
VAINSVLDSSDCLPNVELSDEQMLVRKPNTFSRSDRCGVLLHLGKMGGYCDTPSGRGRVVGAESADQDD